MNEKLKTFAAALSLVPLASCVTPIDLLRVHAYDGQPKKASEIATLYGSWNSRHEATYICDIDGKSYSKVRSAYECPSVVYLTPGEHFIDASYKYDVFYARTRVDVRVLPGRTYKLTGTSTDGLKTARFHVEEMPEGFELKFKDIVSPAAHEQYKKEIEKTITPDNPNY